jgi:hypothetical protein
LCQCCLVILEKCVGQRCGNEDSLAEKRRPGPTIQLVSYVRLAFICSQKHPGPSHQPVTSRHWSTNHQPSNHPLYILHFVACCYSILRPVVGGISTNQSRQHGLHRCGKWGLTWPFSWPVHTTDNNQMIHPPPPPTPRGSPITGGWHFPPDQNQNGFIICIWCMVRHVTLLQSLICTISLNVRMPSSTPRPRPQNLFPNTWVQCFEILITYFFAVSSECTD